MTSTSFAIHRRLPQATDVSRTILADLFSEASRIAPRYFYDPMGCALYEAITLLDEYYPTRTEKALLHSASGEIARARGEGAQFIDLGSGDSAKAALLLPVLKPSAYLAVDIAESAIARALPKLDEVAPTVKFEGLVTDFSSTLELDGLLAESPRLFFYPGSSIGNFSPDEATAFIARVRGHCRTGIDQLLIGVDTVKAKSRLDAAYDDALGVTAAFNRNVLRNINRLAGTDFSINDWRHVGFFNPDASRIEMHLEALRDVVVSAPGHRRAFTQGARIHTENSYKYTRAGFERILNAAGFDVAALYTDANEDFYVFLAHAR